MILMEIESMQDSNLKVMVIGSGGREHTLAKVCSGSPMVRRSRDPGNAGIAQEFKTLELPIENNSMIVQVAQENQIDLVVVGPEVPFATGGRCP